MRCRRGGAVLARADRFLLRTRFAVEIKRDGGERAGGGGKGGASGLRPLDTVGTGGEQRIDLRETFRRNVAEFLEIPEQVAAPHGVGIRSADFCDSIAVDDDIVGERRMRRTQRFRCAAAHHVVRGIVDEGIERDDAVVRTRVFVGSAVGRVGRSVADGDRDVISLEVITENLMTAAVDADSLGVAKIISVNDTVAALAQGELGERAVDKRVVAKRIPGRTV